jgi:hypothetical protein
MGYRRYVHASINSPALYRGLRVCDRLLALGLGALAGVVTTGLILNGNTVMPVLLPVMLVPSLILWRSPQFIWILVFLALPYEYVAYAICDFEPSAATWGVLHWLHGWLPMFGVYALLRLVLGLALGKL